MASLKVSIQAPGRGSTLTAEGNAESARYGAESPIPITVKIANDWAVGEGERGAERRRQERSGAGRRRDCGEDARQEGPGEARL